MVVIDKIQKSALVIDITIANNSNIKKKRYEKLEKYQRQKEELKKM